MSLNLSRNKRITFVMSDMGPRGGIGKLMLIVV